MKEVTLYGGSIDGCLKNLREMAAADESGVRTDDWFDIDKVRRVLEICEPIINKYK